MDPLSSWFIWNLSSANNAPVILFLCETSKQNLVFTYKVLNPVSVPGSMALNYAGCRAPFSREMHWLSHGMAVIVLFWTLFYVLQ